MLQCTSGVSPFPLFFFFLYLAPLLYFRFFFFFRLGEHSLLVLLSPACCMRFSCQSPYTFLFLLFFFSTRVVRRPGKKTHTHICKYIYIQAIDFFLLSLMSKSIHVKRTGSLCAIALGDSAWHFLLQACQRREKKKKIVELCWRLYFRFRSKKCGDVHVVCLSLCLLVTLITNMSFFFLFSFSSRVRWITTTTAAPRTRININTSPLPPPKKKGASLLLF